MLSKIKRTAQKIFRPTIITWAPVVTSILAGYLAGLSSAPWLNSSVLDGGVATLVGSALGASITVAGSLWIARYQTELRERSFARFVADAAAAIRDEAYVLTSLLCIDDWEDNVAYAEKIKKQVQYVAEAIDLFQKNSPFSDIGNYEARLWLSRLEEAIQSNQRILDKELIWLDRPTRKVLENARGDLAVAAEAMFTGCVHVCRELRHNRELLSDEALERRLNLLN
jgi:hypothetical protein